MNFLAHCALAADAADYFEADHAARRGLIAGGVVGDFIKGGIPSDWPLALQAGVRLHRKIDAVSNHEENIRRLSHQFPAHLRRFAPIVLDLVYDYALSHEWSKIYQVPLPEFAQECYLAIESHEAYLTKNGRRFFEYLRQEDLLTQYSDWSHVKRGTTSVLRRLNRLELLEDMDQAMQVNSPQAHVSVSALLTNLRTPWQEWSPFIAAPQSS